MTRQADLGGRGEAPRLADERRQGRRCPSRGPLPARPRRRSGGGRTDSARAREERPSRNVGPPIHSVHTEERPKKTRQARRRIDATKDRISSGPMQCQRDGKGTCPMAKGSPRHWGFGCRWILSLIRM
jgi:hypothetical protein